jgi:hypothetical protein
MEPLGNGRMDNFACILFTEVQIRKQSHPEYCISPFAVFGLTILLL